MKTQSKGLVQGDYTQLVVIAAQGLDPRVSAIIGHHKMGSGPQPYGGWPLPSAPIH